MSGIWVVSWFTCSASFSQETPAMNHQKCLCTWCNWMSFVPQLPAWNQKKGSREIPKAQHIHKKCLCCSSPVQPHGRKDLHSSVWFPHLSPQEKVYVSAMIVSSLFHTNVGNALPESCKQQEFSDLNIWYYMVWYTNVVALRIFFHLTSTYHDRCPSDHVALWAGAKCVSGANPISMCKASPARTLVKYFDANYYFMIYEILWVFVAWRSIPLEPSAGWLQAPTSPGWLRTNNFRSSRCCTTNLGWSRLVSPNGCCDTPEASERLRKGELHRVVEICLQGRPSWKKKNSGSRGASFRMNLGWSCKAKAKEFWNLGSKSQWNVSRG